MEKVSKIYVAGHRGLVGSALIRRLKKDDYHHLTTRTHSELDLTIQADVNRFFEEESPDYVFLAAAKVGGIHANDSRPADFIRDNMNIQLNIIDAAFRNNTKKLLFLGSSCIYPKLAPQPLKEEYLLTGDLEPTNQWYAIAKIAGIKMCQAYRKQYGFNAISVMPTNLYGPNDNFDLQTSHVLPALIRKFHEAKVNNEKSVTVWGTGKPKREFLHVDDLANACLFLMSTYNSSNIINIGIGKEITISDLSKIISDIVEFKGDIIFDHSKPDGISAKLMDASKLQKMGLAAKIQLEDGIEKTYRWFLKNAS